jgi:alkylhydroperoxidase family enzyme
LSDAHKAVLGLADAFLRDPHGLSEDARAALLRHYTPEQVVELAMGLAMYMGTSKIAIALGNEPVDMPITEHATPDRPPAG